MKLSIKGKIATIAVFPIFIMGIIAMLTISFATWLMAKTLQITGVLESLTYLLESTKQAIKRNKFLKTLTTEDQQLMKNGKK